MLILHRRRSEAVRIGEDIRIVVLESNGGGTRLGIEAPGHVTILREEIMQEVADENLRASQLALEMDLWTPPGEGGDGSPSP